MYSTTKAGCGLSSIASLLVSQLFRIRRPLGLLKLLSPTVDCSNSYAALHCMLLISSFVSSVHYTTTIMNDNTGGDK